MSLRIPFRQVLIVLLFLFSAGCSSQEQASESTAVDGADGVEVALTAADLERFLAVVQNHSEALIPEFTPPEEDAALDLNLPAAELVAAYRGEVKRLFDAGRQGALWEQDQQWTQALVSQKISAKRFAALVRKVSLAIMRVRLDARVDVEQLVVQAKRQVDRSVRVLDEIDALPAADRTRESNALRANSVEKLGKAVALFEFAEMVRKVPAGSSAIICKYSPKLKPLLPPHANDELLAELKELATPRNGEAKHARYDDADPDDER